MTKAKIYCIFFYIYESILYKLRLLSKYFKNILTLEKCTKY